MTVSIANATFSAFGISALLSFALVAPTPIAPRHMLSGVGVAIQVPAPATTDQSAVISAAQLAKLQKALDERGKDFEISPSLMTALQLKTTKLRQVATHDQESKFFHIFVRLPDGGFLLFVREPVIVRNYRLDNDFKFIVAVIMIDNKPSGTPIDAEHAAQTELAFWAKMADQL